MSSYGQEHQRCKKRNRQSLWRRGDIVTREEIEQKMDELARKYVETHAPEIREEICSLADQLWEMEKLEKQ
jgi:hypothetical protein